MIPDCGDDVPRFSLFFSRNGPCRDAQIRRPAAMRSRELIAAYTDVSPLDEAVELISDAVGYLNYK